MGPLKNLLLALLIAFPVLVLSQDEEIIPWSPERKLEWSDFKGTYFKTEWAAATTASSISYKFSTFEKEGRLYVDFEIGALFFPDRSWYRPELCNDLTLSHEQLHFDITELHARTMRKRLAEAQFTENIKEEVRIIYKGVLKELLIFQNRYDRETNFSRDIHGQKIWNKKDR